MTRFIPTDKQLELAVELSNSMLAAGHSEWIIHNVASALLVNKLEAEAAELNNRHNRNRSEIHALRSLLSEVVELIPAPPEKDCSCHINPPCSDCVDNGGTRELLERIRAELKKDS